MKFNKLIEQYMSEATDSKEVKKIKDKIKAIKAKIDKGEIKSEKGIDQIKKLEAEMDAAKKKPVNEFKSEEDQKADWKKHFERIEKSIEDRKTFDIGDFLPGADPVDGDKWEVYKTYKDVKNEKPTIMSSKELYDYAKELYFGEVYDFHKFPNLPNNEK